MITSLLAAGALAACAPDPRVADLAKTWTAREAFAALDVADAQAALCFRKALMAELGPQIGRQVGYKVGIYSAAGRAAYNTDRPLLGELYEKMLLAPGATVRADYGVGANWENDFILVVKDESLNTAKTREEIYAGLRAYRPFIELPARNFPTEMKLSAHQLSAVDVAARLGVIGPEVPLPKDGLAKLAAMSTKATVTSAAGETSDSAVTAQFLGDPIDIVTFARDAVVASGRKLKAGDLISVGTLSPAKPPKAGDTVTVQYQVFDGPPASVLVSFN